MVVVKTEWIVMAQSIALDVTDVYAHIYVAMV